jgi:hypothetical protein
MKKVTLVSAALLLASSFATNASTVLTPTDGDVNIYISFGNFAGLTSGYSLYMFDDSVSSTLQMSTADSLAIASNQIVGITGPVNGSDFIATSTNPVNTLTLTGSSSFILGLTDGTDWFMDTGTGSLLIGANTEIVNFDFGNSVIVADVTVSAVPLPAAVWLFGAGLVGLAGVARRKA